MALLARVEVFAADEIAERLRRVFSFRCSVFGVQFSVFSFRCSVFRESQLGVNDATRVRPDVVKEWSDAEAARWLMLFPERPDEQNAGRSTQTGCTICAVLTKWSSGKARHFCSNGLDARTRLGGAKRRLCKPAVAN
jgi:hypothetical protein